MTTDTYDFDSICLELADDINKAIGETVTKYYARYDKNAINSIMLNAIATAAGTTVAHSAKMYAPDLSKREVLEYFDQTWRAAAKHQFQWEREQN